MKNESPIHITIPFWGLLITLAITTFFFGGLFLNEFSTVIRPSLTGIETEPNLSPPLSSFFPVLQEGQSLDSIITNPNPINIKSLGIYTVTAYCSCEKCCGIWATKPGPRKTANGHVIEPNDRFVAAPKEIPFRTMLAIKGYSNEGGFVFVYDRGGSIKGRKLDVFFPTHQEALNWGVKKMEVFEVKEDADQTSNP